MHNTIGPDGDVAAPQLSSKSGESVSDDSVLTADGVCCSDIGDSSEDTPSDQNNVAPNRADLDCDGPTPDKPYQVCLSTGERLD